MLIVQSDGALNGGVGKGVAVCQVLGNNSGTWLIFLIDIAIFC